MVRGIVWAALVASVGVGCVDGVGVECEQHADCNGGLRCEKEPGAQKGQCAACEDGVSCLGVDLVLRSCDARLNPMDGTTALKVTVLKEDGTALKEPSVVDLGAKTLPIPELPLGEKLRLVVEALETRESTVPKARGSTAFFSSTATSPAANQVVYMRAVSEFTPLNARTQPASCLLLTDPRAGHTATVLADGRVFVAGGYSVGENGEKGDYLASTELIDLRNGTVTRGPTLQFPRAGHGAAFIPPSDRYPQGQVLLLGGETSITGTGGERIVEATIWAELFDPAKPESMERVRAKEQRMRHGTAVLPNGFVFVAGGTQTQTGAPLITTEFFNPNAAGGTEFEAGNDLTSARTSPAVVALPDGRVYVLGGVDRQNAPLKSVEAFTYDAAAGRFLPGDATGLALGAARFEPLAVPFALQDGPGILVAGKPLDGSTRLSDSFDVLSLSGTPVEKDPASTPPRYRGGACIAGFPGGAIVVGGQLGGIADLQDSTDVYTLNPDGKVRAAYGGKLTVARKAASCTSLPDGTVLVTGGQQFVEGAHSASGVVEIYQPL